MISKRLKSIAGLVTLSDKVIDVGCDHSLLGIYLIKNQIIESLVASDINQNALAAGFKNIKKHKCEDKIDLKLGDGISVIDENINTAIIAGIGINSIVKILSHPHIKYLNKLIIQSTGDYFLLRGFICSKGFYISHEAVIYEKGKYYINIVFQRGKKKYSIKELRFGPILMYANKEYFGYLLKKQEAIIENIPFYKFSTRSKLKSERRFLRKLAK